MTRAAVGPLWDFAVGVYGAPGVADACLRLQERHGVDVPVLLFAAWTGAKGELLSAAEVPRIAASVADWQLEVVLPLRALRRRLKAGPAPAPSAETDRLRQSVKAAELAAERIELAVLERLGGAFAGGGSDPDAIGRNLEAAFRHRTGARPDAAARDDLAAMAAAASRLGEPRPD